MNNRIKIKPIIVAMLLISLIIGVCGCMSEAEREAKRQAEIKEEKEIIIQEILQEMKDRYNDEFTYIGGGSENWNASYEEIYVSSESHPEKAIMIRRDKETGEMTDNYLTYYLADEVEAIFNPIVREVYPESKVIYSGLDSPRAGLTPDMTAQEMVDYLNEWTSLYMTVCVYDINYLEKKDEDIEKLRLAFKENGYKPDIILFYLKEGKIDFVDRTNEIGTLTGVNKYKWIYMRGDVIMDGSYNFSYSEWRVINNE